MRQAVMQNRLEAWIQENLQIRLNCRIPFPHHPYLLPQRNDLLRGFQIIPEQIAHAGNHPLRGGRILQLSHTCNNIQRIKKEMGVNLTL